MAKIVINNTASPVPITDVGVTIPSSGSYTIPSNDYQLWAQSNDVIVVIGNATVKINDGSFDLSISDGTDLIKGLFPKKIGVLAGNDLTAIGHVSDKLKVIDQDVIAVLNAIASSLGASTTSILKSNEASVSSRTEFDLANTTYTVPTGKMFSISSFAASYDAQAMLYVRLKKQTGGAGAWVTLFRTTMMSGGQGDATTSMNFGNGINIGAAGDIFKITIEGSIAKGTIWAEYSGSEI